MVRFARGMIGPEPGEDSRGAGGGREPTARSRSRRVSIEAKLRRAGKGKRLVIENGAEAEVKRSPTQRVTKVTTILVSPGISGFSRRGSITPGGPAAARPAGSEAPPQCLSRHLLGWSPRLRPACPIRAGGVP